MTSWKVILATLVIFCSGLVIGALVINEKSRPAPLAQSTQRNHTNAPSAWNLLQKELVRKLDRELDFTPDQRTRIEKILKDSQERTKQIREKIAPEMREELKNVREQIRSELDPEQQKKFEQSMKTKQRKADELNEESRRKKDGPRRHLPNAPSTDLTPANP